MSELKDYLGALKSAKEHIDYMVEDATDPEENSLHAVMESAEEAMRQIMRALTMLVVNAEKSGRLKLGDAP